MVELALKPNFMYWQISITMPCCLLGEATMLVFLGKREGGREADRQRDSHTLLCTWGPQRGPTNPPQMCSAHMHDSSSHNLKH